ncbi:hypothetical protein, partial [Acinetobacter baumannii]|uniref:hypothetical protein n=1 Tax=Acinetobacter baumannii TaxID=470 RepID=UPI00148918E9
DRTVREILRQGGQHRRQQQCQQNADYKLHGVSGRFFLLFEIRADYSLAATFAFDAASIMASAATAAALM